LIHYVLEQLEIFHLIWNISNSTKKFFLKFISLTNLARWVLEFLCKTILKIYKAAKETVSGPDKDPVGYEGMDYDGHNEEANT